jgi:hypothetical protein
MQNLQANWKESKLTVTSVLLPKLLWQTASIDVFLDEKCVLRTGGQLKLTGSHSGHFDHAEESHEVTLTWGHADLRSFPVEVLIDAQSVVSARVFTRNWPMALWPWVALVIFAAYAAIGK